MRTLKMARIPHKQHIFLLFVIVLIACAICRKMEDYGFCNKCFSEHIFTPEADMRGLAQIAITQSLSNASTTVVFAKQTMRAVTNQELVDYFKLCINGYLKILDMIENTDRVFGDNNYNAVLTDFLNLAKVLATECGQYSNSHGIRNPLYESNREERILVTMTAATAYSLLH